MASYPPPPVPDPHYNTSIYYGVTNNQAAGDNVTSGYNGPALPGITKLAALTTRDEQSLYPLIQELRRPNDKEQQSSELSRSETTPQSATQSPAEASLKSAPRLRKACDSCSLRKVKCDESGPPCRACTALDIPCTFSRPTKRRGPPNRIAQAFKRQKMEEQLYDSSSVSPSDAAQPLAALSSQTSVPCVSAESICSLETLDLLIEDFFTYVHPLCPFPHEPTFREAWESRKDLTDRRFLALLASMIGALVASFPRKPRLQLKAQHKEKLYPSHMAMVLQCQRVCTEARGSSYLESDDLDVYDVVTSYFLALTGMYTLRHRQGRLYFGECLTMIRVLDLHKPNAAATHQSYNTPDDGGRVQRDHITQQLGYRLFWTVFAGTKTLQQLGLPCDEIYIPPPTSTSPYPPLPVEVDDAYIFQDRIDAQPAGLVPILAGFNANIKAFASYNNLATMEVAWGIDHVVDWERQRRVLREALNKCRDATASLPQELQVALQSQSPNNNGPVGLFAAAQSTVIPARSLLSLAGVQNDDLMHQTAQQRRHVQYEIQKANIYASSLATRSYIVQKYWNLVEAHARLRTQHTPVSRPDSPHSPTTSIIAAGLDGVLPHQAGPTSNFNSMDQEFRAEREIVVKDLLVVLGTIDQVNMEPNADSFKLKIRSIASTLLDAPDAVKGHMELQVREYLAAFLDILMKLDRVSTSDGSQQDEDEAAELRHWADLRDYQMKLAQQSGL